MLTVRVTFTNISPYYVSPLGNIHMSGLEGGVKKTPEKTANNSDKTEERKGTH